MSKWIKLLMRMLPLILEALKIIDEEDVGDLGRDVSGEESKVVVKELEQ